MKKGFQYISAVIITYNEEANLERCLASLEGIFDEIVVIDSGSTDKTIEIANRFGIDPIYQKFLGFGYQKRFAVQAARNDYVFSIDADEELSPELRDAILSIENITDHDAYQINRLSSCDGRWIRHSGWHPDWLVRLWNRKKGNWNQNLVHETIELSTGASKRRLNGLLMHYTCQNLASHFSTTSNYAELKVRNRGKKKMKGFFSSVLSAKFKWLKIYLLKLGFIDGKMGFRIASISSLGYIMQYAAGRKVIQSNPDKRNICFVNTTKFWGGGEKWHWEAAKRLNENNITVYGIAAANSPLSEKLESKGIIVHKMYSGALSFVNPVKVYRLIKFFKMHEIQKVIINGSADLKTCGLAAWLAGVPDIIYRRGLAKAPNKNTLNTFLFTSVVNRFIANSEETLGKLLNWTELPVEKFSHQVIYNGIKLEDYEVSQGPNQGKEIIIGSAGRLSKEKGFDLLLAIAVDLKEKGLTFRLNIAGEGPEKDGLNQMILDKGLQEEVRLLGFTNDIPGFMSGLDLFVSTSKGEGFGFVLAEAMASGLPVVAFNVAGIPEVVEHGKTGILIEPFNLDKFSASVEQLASDQGLRHRLGMSGRKRVETLFSQERQMDKLQELLFGVV